MVQNNHPHQAFSKSDDKIHEVNKSRLHTSICVLYHVVAVTGTAVCPGSAPDSVWAHSRPTALWQTATLRLCVLRILSGFCRDGTGLI